MVSDDQLRRFMESSGWDKLSTEELAEAVAEELDKLVKQELVERLVGEDGNFYYRSTRSGRGE